MIKEELIGMIKGQKSLKATFWIYGIFVVYIIFEGILYGMDYIDVIYNSDYYFEIYCITVAIFLIISFLIYIGIWKASDLYNGKKIWAISAKFFVLLSIIFDIYNVYTIYKNYNTSEIDSKVEEMVQRWNLILPSLNDGIRTEKVKFINDSIVLTYTLMDKEKNEINISDYELKQKEMMKNKLCNDTISLEVLNNLIVYKFIYKDKNDEEITDIKIFDIDCEITK